MRAVQNIRAKSGASPQKARATASKDEEDSESVASASDETVEDTAAKHAAPPPGMGKLVDRTV
jgi:hypothetical protein